MNKDTGSGKPRHEKLGVKPGQGVAVVGRVDVGSDLDTLGAKAASVEKADWILLAIDVANDLRALAIVRKRMHDDRVLWCVYVKGRKELSEKHVREHALAGDLDDVKVMSWSETHTGLKLVVRKERRK